MSKDVGFIPEFRDFVLEHIPTSSDWAESIAISLLSTACGGEIYVRSKIGHLKLNVWFLMIGPSGMAYKSTPLNYFVYPVLTALTEQVGYNTILPSRYSLEGMIEYLSKYCSQGGIIRDEFTSVLKESKGKDYLLDILEFYSELYDGTMQKRFTRGTKLEESKNVYVTFLAATTPYFYRIMKPEFFVQGTGNRILPVIFGGLNKEQLNDTPEEFFYSRRDDAIRGEKIGEYAEILSTVQKSRLQQLVPLPEAGQLWLDFRNEVFLGAKERFEKDPYDLNYTYMVRLPEFAIKLSALHAISRSYTRLIREEMPIMDFDMKWGIDKTKNYYKHFQQLLKEWGLRPESANPVSFDQMENTVCSVLESYKEGMSWREFRHKFKWGKRHTIEVLSSLHDQNRIIFATKRTLGRGRKATLIFVKKYKGEAQKHDIIKDWNLFTFAVNLRN